MKKLICAMDIVLDEYDSLIMICGGGFLLAAMILAAFLFLFGIIGEFGVKIMLYIGLMPHILMFLLIFVRPFGWM